MDFQIAPADPVRIDNKWALWRPIYQYTWAKWQRSSYRHFADYINALDNATVLDLGTGIGSYIHLLKPKANTRIIFTDPDSLSLAQAAAVPSPWATNFIFDVLDAESAVAKYSEASHISLVHVYSVLTDPEAFLERCHQFTPHVTMLIYLSRFNGMRGLDHISSALGFKQIDVSLLKSRFQHEAVGRLNVSFRGPP